MPRKSGQHARHDSKIVVIERTGMNADPHLARPRKPGIRQIGQCKLLQRSRGLEYNTSHGDALVIGCMVP